MADSNFCSRCGAHIKQGEEQCSYCGSYVKKELGKQGEVSVNTIAPINFNAKPQIKNYNTEKNSDFDYNYHYKSKKKNKVNIAPIVFFIVVLVVVMILRVQYCNG